jgi:hypothetical protein
VTREEAAKILALRFGISPELADQQAGPVLDRLEELERMTQTTAQDTVRPAGRTERHLRLVRD